MEDKKPKNSGFLGDIAPFFFIIGGCGILGSFIFENRVDEDGTYQSFESMFFTAICILAVGGVLYIIDRIKHN